jgi:hypothetical protein
MVQQQVVLMCSTGYSAVFMYVVTGRSRVMVSIRPATTPHAKLFKGHNAMQHVCTLQLWLISSRFDCTVAPCLRCSLCAQLITDGRGSDSRPVQRWQV